MLGARAVPGARVRRRDLHPRDLVGFRDLWVTELALTVLEPAVLPVVRRYSTGHSNAA